MLKRNIKYLTVLLLLLLVLILPVKTMANIGSYKLEQGIPFISAAKDASGNPILLSYEDFNKLFQKFITTVYIIAAIAAFIKILIAGIRWYTSGGSSKAISQSKEDIKNGIIGLCFLFLAGVLLEFINPNLNKLSSIFTPNAGTQCNQSGDTGLNNTGNLVAIPGTKYYAQSSLVTALKSSGLTFSIGTGCTNTNENSCNPNYCNPDGCEDLKKGGPCVMANVNSTTCKPILSIACHFNGNCVDISPSGGVDSTVLRKLQCAGLDVLNEYNKDCQTGSTTGNNLHVALPDTFTPSADHSGSNCWFQHQPSNSQYCQGSGGGGVGGW